MLNGNNLCYFEPDKKGVNLVSRLNRGAGGISPLDFFWNYMCRMNNLCFFEPDKYGCTSRVDKERGQH